MQLEKTNILYRARLLAASGAAAVFDHLHPDLAWGDSELRWDRPHMQVVELGGRGLLLVPVVLS